jgi:hypothetical protein
MWAQPTYTGPCSSQVVFSVHSSIQFIDTHKHAEAEKIKIPATISRDLLLVGPQAHKKKIMPRCWISVFSRS